MKKRIRIWISAVFAMVSLTGLSAQSGTSIVATNAWTAAFVEMAGGEAELLAPADMVHPPEYELKISDVAKIRDADYLVFAGYEVLMKTVFDSFEKPAESMIKITTSYAPQMLEESVLSIAEKIGTVPTARTNIAAYKAFISRSREQLKEAGLFGKSVIVNFHQRPLIQSLGFEVLDVFGPQPLSSGDIARLGKVNPDFIIDNIHNRLSGPLEEILDKDSIVLINFPQYPLGNGVKAPAGLKEIASLNLERILERY